MCILLVFVFTSPFSCHTFAGIDNMDPDAQREFVRDHMDADMQFILGESGVSLENQVAISRHYGSLLSLIPNQWFPNAL